MLLNRRYDFSINDLRYSMLLAIKFSECEKYNEGSSHNVRPSND